MWCAEPCCQNCCLTGCLPNLCCKKNKVTIHPGDAGDRVGEIVHTYPGCCRWAVAQLACVLCNLCLQTAEVSTGGYNAAQMPRQTKICPNTAHHTHYAIAPMQQCSQFAEASNNDSNQSLFSLCPVVYTCRAWCSGARDFFVAFPPSAGPDHKALLMGSAFLASYLWFGAL